MSIVASAVLLVTAAVYVAVDVGAYELLIGVPVAGVVLGWVAYPYVATTPTFF